MTKTLKFLAVLLVCLVLSVFTFSFEILSFDTDNPLLYALSVTFVIAQIIILIYTLIRLITTKKRRFQISAQDMKDENYVEILENCKGVNKTLDEKISIAISQLNSADKKTQKLYEICQIAPALEGGRRSY